VLDSAAADAAMAQAADATTLPPNGDARREELKRRSDALRQAADEMAAAAGIESIDPSKLQPENEIAQHFNPATHMLDVSKRQPGYEYRWESANPRLNGVAITMAKNLGWELVVGNDPEAREHREVDGTRRVGDAILMRIRTERYVSLQARQRRINLARSEGIDVAVLEQAEKAGIVAHDLASSKTPQHIRRHAEAQVESARAARAAFVASGPQARPGANRMTAAEHSARRLGIESVNP
jgi:hypothetical protein